MAGRHQFFRIFIFQTVEPEIAALGDAYALGQQFGRVNLRQPHAQAQMALGVGIQRVSGVGDRGVKAHRGQQVLQGAARTHVHVHVARRDQRQSAGASQFAQAIELRAVVGAAQEFGRDPGASGKVLRDAACRFRIRLAVRNQQCETAADTAIKIVPVEAVTAFRAASPRGGDELRQVTVSRAVRREQHEPGAIGNPELGTDDKFQFVFLGRKMRACHARERAFIGNGQRRVPELCRTRGEFFRARGAAQESEVADAVQFCVFG